MTSAERHEFEQLRQQQALAPPADASNLVLSQANLARARQVRQAFAERSDGDPAEELLEELIAGEIGVGHQLQDLEGVATALLGRTLMEPELALHVVKVAREIAALSSAVRRRTENSLNAVAGLRAQRLLVAAHRARRDV